ncbi:phosphatase PAP2 family protein [Amycolatopsis acididurans]|nr:phosphatase PAP2 family protein [Amycolatopsis acididurans]
MAPSNDQRRRPVVPSVNLASAPPAMPRPLRLPLSVTAGLAAIVVLVLGIAHAGAVDDEWAAPIVWLHGAVWYLANAIDFLGEPAGSTIVFVVLTVAFVLAARPRSALLVVAGPGLTVAATTLLKPVVGRRIHEVYLSFPSGHTAFATAMALVIGMLLAGRLALGAVRGTVLVLGLALLAAVVMGWGEVALSAHYVTDAVGGFCTALAIAPPVALAVDKLSTTVLRR